MQAQRPQITVSTAERTEFDDLGVRIPRVTRLAVRNINPRRRNVSGGSTRSNMASQTEGRDDGASDSITSLAANHAVAQDNSAPSTSGASITVGNSAVDNTPVAQYATVRGDVPAIQVSPVRAHSPRVLALAAIASPLHLADGSAIHHEILLGMAEELETARIEGRFPNTTTSYRNAQAVVDDYEHFQSLSGLSPGTEQYTTLYVENARRIQERDSQTVHENRDAHVRHTVQGLLRNQDVGEDLHAIVRQAARVASANAIERALANHNQQATHADVVRAVSQTVIRTMAEQGLVSGQAVDNVDEILEEIFGTIEAGILDATGPLRLNVNLMRDANNEHLVANNNLRDNVTRLDNTIDNSLSNLTTQVGALGTNVGAVGTHVNALGTLMQVMNSTATRTNDQMGNIGNEINSLQQITAMLPALIQEIVQQTVQQILPGAIQAALAQTLTGALQGGNGKPSIIAAAQAMALSEKLPIISEKEIKITKKTKKRGFFSRLFKRGGGKKDGDAGSAY
ncbi:chaperonin [Pestalotiopsis sp. IQ-011]